MIHNRHIYKTWYHWIHTQHALPRTLVVYTTRSVLYIHVIFYLSGFGEFPQNGLSPERSQVDGFLVCYGKVIADNVLYGLMHDQVELHCIVRVVEGFQEEPFL